MPKKEKKKKTTLTPEQTERRVLHLLAAWANLDNPPAPTEKLRDFHVEAATSMNQLTDLVGTTFGSLIGTKKVKIGVEDTGRVITTLVLDLAGDFIGTKRPKPR
jgi:hypothetical protein